MKRHLSRAALIGISLVYLHTSAVAAELKIAAWNIAWLNKESGKGFVKRDDADYAKLGAYAKKLDADIIVLAEVQGVEAAKRVFDPALYSFHFESRPSDQMVGFAIKKTVAYIGNPDYAELGLTRGLRRGADITVAANGRTLRLLAVHLKSGCFDDISKYPKDDCATLTRQTPILERWIDQRAAEPVPFLVIGDFNRRLAIPNDSLWAEIDDAEPPNADLTNAGGNQTALCWDSKYPDYIDHIVADVRAWKMIVPNSFQQLLFDERIPDHRISDHCPISVRVTF